MKYTIDAQGRPLGRVATEIALILQGKKNAAYERNKEGEDAVVVKNVGKISISGGKEKGKIYYRHTGYMGHLRRITYETAFAKSPEEVLRHAVRGMLPKNWLRQDRLNRLKIEK